jgi:RNA polymerase sigma-70 factor (ECF subfamily)
MSIARFKALSALRKRADSALDEEEMAEAPDEADDPSVTLLKRDKGALLRRCLERLSLEHREILDLVYYHEMSIQEVAQVVGIPEGTVKTRMFHARKRLSEILRAHGVDRGWP